VFVFRLDRDHGRLLPAEPAWMPSQRGAGPRHIAFHPHRPLAYVINELDSTVTTCTFDRHSGRLQSEQTIPSVPPDAGVRNTGAEIVVHPDGRTVYVSNRGHDSVGVFRVQESDGGLSGTSWVSTRGHVPRAMALDPQGRFLYVANQSSDTIVAFAVEASSGGLSPLEQVVETGSPSSIVFTPV